MPTFNYVIAKFVPDLVRNEPINIGVIVHDSKNKIATGKFIDNFRALAQRYHNVNVSALKGILSSFTGSYKIDSANYLSKLGKEFQYQLVFAEPSGIVAGTPEQALSEIYGRFISIDTKRQKRIALTKPQLRALVSQGIKKAEFDRKWVQVKPRIEGTIGHFVFDYGFKNGKVRDLVHTISFDVNPETALRDAKALAISVEDALSRDEELSCTAIIHPPHKDAIVAEYYEPAIGYLKDKDCDVKDEEHIQPYLLTVKSKLSKLH